MIIERSICIRREQLLQNSCLLQLWERERETRPKRPLEQLVRWLSYIREWEIFAPDIVADFALIRCWISIVFRTRCFFFVVDVTRGVKCLGWIMYCGELSFSCIYIYTACASSKLKFHAYSQMRARNAKCPHGEVQSRIYSRAVPL